MAIGKGASKNTSQLERQHLRDAEVDLSWRSSERSRKDLGGWAEAQSEQPVILSDSAFEALESKDPPTSPENAPYSYSDCNRNPNTTNPTMFREVDFGASPRRAWIQNEEAPK